MRNMRFLWFQSFLKYLSMEGMKSTVRGRISHQKAPKTLEKKKRDKSILIQSTQTV